MNNRVVRTIVIVIGALALIVGLVFTGQGAGVIPGGFMSGSTFWLEVGVILAIVGVILIVVGVVRGRRRK
ncbi:MAG TPA: hypothetical protein VGM70_09445 [Pseudolysinimonas sp.]|jgi:hypothetical protein